MFSGNLTPRTGILAGGIAMIVALFTMQMVSKQIGPNPMLTQTMAFAVLDQLLGFSGEFANFVLSGSLARVVIFIVVVFMMVGCGLGSWISTVPDLVQSRAMLSAAILFMATFGLIYTTNIRLHRYFLEEFAMSLGITFIVFGAVLLWLLEPRTNQTRWTICGSIAFVGAAYLMRELLLL